MGKRYQGPEEIEEGGRRLFNAVFEYSPHDPEESEFYDGLPRQCKRGWEDLYEYLRNDFVEPFEFVNCYERDLIRSAESYMKHVAWSVRDGVEVLVDHLTKNKE